MNTPADVDAFLARPLTAYLATSGPRVRPVWFLWEGRAFWMISGPWSKVPRHIERDPAVALAIGVSDHHTGEVKQVVVRGHAGILPWDDAGGLRLLRRYLGEDVEDWDERFRSYLRGEPGCVWVRLSVPHPRRVDLSFSPGHRDPRSH